MSATGTNTSMQGCWSLVNCVVNHQVLQAICLIHTADMSQLTNVINSGFVHTLLNACMRPFIPVSTYVKDIKIRQDFPELWSQMCCHVFSYSKSALSWVWNVIVSFSQGSVSTLFRWGGYIFHVCVKRFFLLIAVQKLLKSSVFFQSYDHKMYCHVFFGSQCIYMSPTACIQII